MQALMSGAFDISGLIPHGFCLKWNPLLLWTLVSSDSVIAISYFSIPFGIWYFAQRRPDVQNRWLLVLFALFITACGITHLLDVLMIWKPTYWASAIAKLFTALLSFGTAIAVWRFMPVALQAPSVQQLEQARGALEDLNAELEQRVEERTNSLTAANLQLEDALEKMTLLNQEIQQEKALLRSLLDNIPDYIFIKDTTGKYLRCNKAVETYFGRQESNIIGKTDFEFVDAATADAFRQQDAKVLASRELSVNEEMIIHPDGSRFFLETLKIPFKDAQGHCLGLIGVGRNITDRKLAERKLQLAANVFSYAREGIMITDADANIVEVNDAFSRITGFSRDEVVGKNPRVLQSGRQSEDFYASMWQSLREHGHWSGEVWNRHKNGRVYAEMITISSVLDASGDLQNYVALFTDITQMKEHQLQLEYIAHYDALTGLPNRVLLTDRLEQAMLANGRRHRSIAVVFIDLDGFKAVNDSHDHQVGDALLIEISLRMKDVLRDGDTLARIGGDEFVAVLVDLGQEGDCEPILRRLLNAAADPATLNCVELQVSASIGVTFHPADGADADQLIRHADQAMYMAKQAGKNRYCLFDLASDSAIKTQQEQLAEILKALDSQEFVLHYQPKVNMKTGEVIGAEALIRWHHPERGLLFPQDFLPVTESHPISIELGEWVIAETLRQMCSWHHAGLDLPVSVNVAAKQLQQANFVERLFSLLQAQSEMQALTLQLEVLETSALEDLAAVSLKIKACREFGVRFALDDFGTGFSSLTYLRHLPVDELKIDRSFVRDMLEDEDDLAIVNSVIGLAHTFHRQVIAEGVETLSHAEKLLAMGCEYAQGYGIARPMPASEIPGWIQRWQAGERWQN